MLQSNMLGKIIKKIHSFRKKELQLKSRETLHVRLEISPHTFITCVEDVDGENIYVPGISEKELGHSLPLPNQKLELHVFSENIVYQFESFFKRQMEQPIYLWVLSRPRKFRKFADRRKASRFENVIEANFNISSNLLRQQRQALTKNISVGGLAFVSPVNLPIGEKIQITLPTIDKMTVTAEVVWKYERPYFDKWYYGVRFVEISEQQETLLAKYINDKLRAWKWAGLD